MKNARTYEYQSYKSSWPLHVTIMDSSWMAKVMLNYGQNGGRRVGRHLNRLLDETETGLLRSDCRLMIIMMMIIFSTNLSDTFLILRRTERVII